MIEAERLYLRELVPADAHGRYVEWMCDPEITQYLESRFQQHTPESLEDFIRAMADDPDTLFLAIVLRKSGLHIGNIKLGPINRPHLTADVGILIGDREQWGHGYASEAIAALSELALRELGLHKLTAGCYEQNIGSARAFEKAGFSREGCRREQYLSHGQHVNEILFGRVATGS